MSEDKAALIRKFDAQIAAAGLRKPSTEFRFAKDTPFKRLWRSDRAWIDERVLIEVEGGIFASGFFVTKDGRRMPKQSRHTNPIGYSDDCEKYAAAAILDYVLIRVTEIMMRDGRGIKLLCMALGKEIGDADVERIVTESGFCFSPVGRQKRVRRDRPEKQGSAGRKPRLARKPVRGKAVARRPGASD